MPCWSTLFLFITVGGRSGFNVALKTIALGTATGFLCSLQYVEDMNALVEVAHVPILCVYYCNGFCALCLSLPEMNHIMEAQMARR